MAEVLHYRGKRADVVKMLCQLVPALAGKIADLYGVSRGIQLRIGVTLLSKIQQNFLRLSRGESSDAGYAWKKLERATIANRRPAPRKKQGERPIGLLTKQQDEFWRKTFGQSLAMLLAKGVPHDQALGIAGKIAWAKTKEIGGKTKLDVYGGRTVDIGRDTGRLLRSLAPGVADRPSGVEEQVFETPTAAVIVGTNVPYAEGFHKLRPLWPEQLPDLWWEAIYASAVRGLLAAAKMLIQSGRRP